ncbi:hydrolase [Planctomycetota bacterium]
MSRFILDAKRSVLAIVDMQERLAAVMDKREAVYANCGHLVEAARLLDVPIIVAEQYPKGLGPTAEEIRTALPAYEPFDKMTFDGCKCDGFIEKLASLDRNQIILTGMEAHVCVLQTCLGLLNNEYNVHVVADAICSRKKSDFLCGRELMRDAGAVITCTETVLFQLLERSGTPEFKAIVKRIK